MNKQRLLDRLDRKFGRFAIDNLMLYIIIGMGAVFIADTFIFPQLNFSLYSAMVFDRALFLKGQVWRAVTFLLLPPDSSLIFIFFSLYFYWFIGSALESQWGSFKFNLFYFTGALCTVAMGFITGFATNYFLNLSLFLAFAIIYPNYELLLFFCIPIKAKWFALFDAFLLLRSFILSGWAGKLALIIAVGNIILFFWGDIVFNIKDWKRRRDFKKKWKG